MGHCLVPSRHYHTVCQGKLDTLDPQASRLMILVQAGMGQHQYYVMDNLSEILKQLTLTQLAASWLICFVKLSVIAFVLRLVGKVCSQLIFT